MLKNYDSKSESLDFKLVKTLEIEIKILKEKNKLNPTELNFLKNHSFIYNALEDPVDSENSKSKSIREIKEKKEETKNQIEESNAPSNMFNTEICIGVPETIGIGKVHEGVQRVLKFTLE